jgi:hypothetical protein
MKRMLFLLILLCLEKALHAQYIYTIKADSVKITNTCDTAELIIENRTQNVCGFLFNKGSGRTEFRRGLIRFNDSTSLIGCDTFKLNAWLQGGNRFGTIGKFGTLDDNPIDYYTNNTFRGRWENNGNFIIGSNADEGHKFQVRGTGGVSINPNLSRPGDRISIGGYINQTDGQNILFATSEDGLNYKNVLVERNGDVGLGIGAPFSWSVGLPPIRCLAYGAISLMPNGMYFGNTPGPYNASALVTAVSDTSEWRHGDYYNPGKNNHYYFGTQLYTATNDNKRAPLWISGRELNFLSGVNESEAMRIAESKNVLIGKTIDDGRKLQVDGSGIFRDQLYVGNNNYVIGINSHHGNGYASGVDASVIAFGNAYATIGVNKQTYGTIPANSLILGGVSPGSVITTTDYYGNPTFMSLANGQVIINGGYSGIKNAYGNDVNANSFALDIKGALGTGAGNPGDIRFWTGKSVASGTTVHDMLQRWNIKGGTGYLSNSTEPTSMVDVTGANGYSQLRLRQSYTPTSSSDTNGSVGDVSWDNNYFYIKTSSGWKRSALETF